MIRLMRQTDWEEVKAIYIEGINTGNATFQKSNDVKEFQSWIKNKIDYSSIIHTESNKILGWASLSKVSSRCVYSGVAEVSVYVSGKSQGKGLGTILLNELIKISENQNIWTIQAGIFPENILSIRLHKKMGFREVGIREKLGKLNGIWRDVVLFERRNKNIT